MPARPQSRLLLTALVVPVVVSLLLVPTVIVASGSAAAAECRRQTVADSTKAAMAVFSGEVTEMTREDRPAGVPGAYLVHEVTVSRVYQGEIDTETVQVRTTIAPPSAQECGLGRLDTGTPYMFFVGGDGDPWVASGNGGTAPEGVALVAQVERLLGAGRPPVEPAPVEAEFTQLVVGEPAPALRAAAPGLAIVLIGLLGLLLVTGLSRR